MKKIRAIGLLSGGLDSIIAAHLLLDQGVEVEGLFISTGFCHMETRLRSPRKKDMEKEIKNHVFRAGKNLDIPIRIINVGDDYLEIIKNPLWGRGSSFNPCVDCRIYMLKIAADIMRREKFSFVFTGEVISQRPMSQMKGTLNLIEKESGLTGLLLRPLSAGLLLETIPEKKGWIDRNKLLDIYGRGRKRQVAMAKSYGIEDYPSPSGGCCTLTDPNLKNRYRALFRIRRNDAITVEDLQLIPIGRHFLLPGKSILIVGREELENHHLGLFKDNRVYIDGTRLPGPAALMVGRFDEHNLGLALRIVARYVKNSASSCQTFKVTLPDGRVEAIKALPLPDEEASAFLL